MTIIIKNKDTLIFKEFKFKCCVGKKGFSKFKNEGDKKTPIGTFALGNLYYRNDKKKRPATKLKVIKIKKNMGWCNDVKSKKNYNKIVKTNSKFKQLTNFDKIIYLFIQFKKFYICNFLCG